MMKYYRQSVKRLVKYFPELSPTFLSQYVHDIFIYDRGRHIDQFLQEAGEVSCSSLSTEGKEIALRVWASKPTLLKTKFGVPTK